MHVAAWDFSVAWVLTLVGIGANLDNTGVGIAYGLSNIRFPHSVNVLVNTIGVSFSFLGGYLGSAISHYISLTAAEVISSVLLCGIGGMMIVSNTLQTRTVTDTAIGMKCPTWRDGLVIGTALSFTNVASSLGASIAGSVPIWMVSLSIGVWGFITIWLGNYGSKLLFARFLGKYAGSFAGMCLILVGLHQIA